MDVVEEARHPVLKLRFLKPSGWKFQEAEDWSVLFAIVETLSLQEAKKEEAPRITLVVRGSLGKSLEDFSTLVTDGIGVTHPNSQRVSQQQRELLHFPAKQMTFSLKEANPNEEFILSVMAAVDGDIGYLIFYSAKESEFFDKMNAFEEVVRTLHFENGVGLDPATRHQILAQEYTQTGHWESAIQELEQLKILQPNNKEIKKNLSYLYTVAGNAAFIKQGDLIKAEDYFEHALVLDQNQPQVKKTLEVVQSARKQQTTSSTTKEVR